MVSVNRLMGTFCLYMFVQIKSERELDKLKGLRLVELWLEGNPMCQHFKDQAMYIRLVKQKPP